MKTKSMDLQPDCFVSGVLISVLRLSRLIGIAPLNFVKKETGWRISLSPSWSIYGYFVATFIILITTGTVISELWMDQAISVRMQTNTRRVVWIVDASIMMLITGTAVYGAQQHMQFMIVCLNQVQKINSELNIRLWPIHSERKKIGIFFFWVVITVTLTLSDYTLLTIFSGLLHGEAWISVMYSFYYCSYWIMQLYEMQFLIITLHVKDSLKGVNDSLKKLMHDSITKSMRLHHETIRRLALVYTSVCDVVREVNQFHGLILLMMLGSFLLHLVCSPYYLLNSLSADSPSLMTTVSSINVAVQLFWCFFHIIGLLTIIEPCHLTHQEVAANSCEQMETTRVLVSHMMRCANSIYDPLAMELELFFKHLVLNQVFYSPLQVTIMSRSLVATILGSITTYLVVIKQL